jgi:hypothetical protein
MGRAVQVEALWNGLRDNSGNPLVSGKVYSYEAGTTTPKALYTASDKSASAANPAILDAYGRTQVWADGAYKLVIKNSADTTLYTLDNQLYGYDTGEIVWGGTSGGTGNAHTSTTTGSITAYAAGQRFIFIAGATNTAATTVNFNSLGAVSIVKGPTPSVLAAGDIRSGDLIDVVYETGGGGRFRLLSATGVPLYEDFVNGRVGIGNIAPTVRLDVGSGAGAETAFLRVNGGSGTDSGAAVSFCNAGTTNFILGTHSSIFGGTQDGTASLWGSTAVDFKLYTNGLERYFCNTDGIHFVNTTTMRNNSRINFDFAALGTGGIAINDTDSANGAIFIAFMTGGTLRGSITNVTNTSVAYNTTSDYRLKDRVRPLTGYMGRLKRVLCRAWNWTLDGSPGRGFIAHELAAEYPEAVTGDKDAVNDDGTPKYQGVDAKFLIADLVAAIQELEDRVSFLEGQ